MILLLFTELHLLIGPLNVFRYPSFRVIVAMATALAVTLFLYPWFIRRLRERQIGQVIREELDENHQSKKGTPTMGGILLIFAAIISTLLWADIREPTVWLSLVVTLLFSVIGFVDDALKLGVRGSKGLSERGKLIGQFGIAGLVMAYLIFGAGSGFDTQLYFPFVSVERFNLLLPPLVYLLFSSFVIVGASNAVNLTDGLDGLAIGPVIVSAATFGILAYLSDSQLTTVATIDGARHIVSFNFSEYLKIPSVAGGNELAVFCAAIAGAGIGFLWYNAFPALVFMGDVGSLGLGGALGAIAVFTKNELLSAIILGLFVMEALSVLLQRYYFKATKGKRIFLMAPIHHHFQKKQWPEAQIVVRFWIISILLCLVALGSLKLR